jgi:hypothetical protein
LGTKYLISTLVTHLFPTLGIFFLLLELRIFKIPILFSMANFDDRGGNVPFKYLASFESQRPTENGERGSFEMDVWGAGEDEIALDLGSSVTQNSGYHVFEPTLPVHANNLIELSRHS